MLTTTNTHTTSSPHPILNTTTTSNATSNSLSDDSSAHSDSPLLNKNKRRSLSLSDCDNPHQEKDEKEITPFWASTQFTLDTFSSKEQKFGITGWLNMYYIEQKVTFLAKLRREFYETENKQQQKNKPEEEKRDLCLLCGESHGALANVNCRDPNVRVYEIKSDGQYVVMVKIIDLRNTVFFLYDLPIDPRRIFEAESCINVTHFHTPRLYYNLNKQLVHIRYSISAELYEHLEMFAFPFDKEFLNLKLNWNHEKNFRAYHHFDETKEAAEKLFDQDLTKTKRPIQIRPNEAVKNTLMLQEPDVDLADTQNKKFGLIKLKVSRIPTYYIFNILFPIFLIVTCSFAVFALDAEDMPDRQSTLVGILLTFTAFQSVISSHLPSLSRMILLDWYVFFAYVIQALLILGNCVVGYLSHRNNKISLLRQIDWIFGCILFAFWILLTMFYASLSSDRAQTNWYHCLIKCRTSCQKKRSCSGCWKSTKKCCKNSFKWCPKCKREDCNGQDRCKKCLQSMKQCGSDESRQKCKQFCKNRCIECCKICLDLSKMTKNCCAYQSACCGEGSCRWIDDLAPWDIRKKTEMEVMTNETSLYVNEKCYKGLTGEDYKKNQ